ncbi:Stk1 family PASTA domain-containing Ser/Thr kinase [Streptomyces sp. NPDC004959]|uniref:Stk1 family PASTA domain-containing Ser/Thr kinase n=1 Tax=unclassified Streptomyces TaxID=2593676 RepID=UPI0004C988C6|nr:Stk1 family PASTA domain-containing Ser/Thr kinase [Streptomyces sp. NRRL F-5630]
MEEPRRLGGRYELGHVLGRGGMAEVYLAHDTRLGRTVAVKTLRVDLARDPSFQARFRREAQSAASLNHPAIVAVYDTGEDYVDGVSIPYIVMEYVDGSTLRELLHSGRKLLPERSMEMTIGILQALEYSHRAGIVHRDIKPANVMLTRTGQVKVMDFGIARAMGDSGMTMTQTAAVIGTAQYLSPEQAQGETVDARSDLYSTGCLLYELLTVRPPFIGDSPVAVAYQHVREEPQPPSVFDPEITPDMDAIVLKALVKDPDYRYQSADDMRADIEALLEGRPVAASAAMGMAGAGGGYGYGGDQPTQAFNGQNGAGPTSMLPPVNPDDGGYGYGEEPRGRRRQAPPKKNHTSTILLVVAGVLVLVGAILIGSKFMGGDDKGSDKVTAPSYVGKTFAEAKVMAQNNGDFELKKVSEPCKDQPAKKVCKQDPVAGTEVDKGSTITLTISTGAPKETVPDVTGLTYETAQAKLQKLGFEVKQETKESEQKEGVVIEQSPNGDTDLQIGKTITLTVARAKEMATVPSVVNQSCDDATAQLEKSNLKANCVEKENDTVPEGTVFEQSLAPNTQAEPDSVVTLSVAKKPEEQEPEKVKIPEDIRMKSLQEVQGILGGLGLQVNVQPGMPNDPGSRVINSNPGPGSEVDKDTPVTVYTMPGR